MQSKHTSAASFKKAIVSPYLERIERELKAEMSAKCIRWGLNPSDYNSYKLGYNR